MQIFFLYFLFRLECNIIIVSNIIVTALNMVCIDYQTNNLINVNCGGFVKNIINHFMCENA